MFKMVRDDLLYTYLQSGWQGKPPGRSVKRFTADGSGRAYTSGHEGLMAVPSWTPLADLGRAPR